MRLDHLAIAAETLEEGVAWAEQTFGVPFLAGGQHGRYGTHNRLLGLEGCIYLEVIAVDPDAQSDVPRWFGLDQFQGRPRLVNWICEPRDFDAALRYGMQSAAMQRADLMWDMGVPADGSLPLGGAYPTVLRWHTDTPPGAQLPSSGWALTTLTITHPQAATIADQLRGELDDLRVVVKTGADTTLQAEFTNAQGDRVSL